MRADLSTIQQTLTQESAAILAGAISEAARRNHGPTTPLHVAATLLSSPNGLLRQACIKSHPNSSHPLQCRALELCFSVALDRIPSYLTSNNNDNNTNSNNTTINNCEPPISNALMAALKRAQAHQRRGCPEQQQSPLLAVKVELEQLVVSILDDPSVSRVMKEASFSSPAVKAAIEQTMSSSYALSCSSASALSSASSSMKNLYMSMQLRRKDCGGGGDEVKKVMEILSREKKRNPVLVGDSDMNSLTREVFERIIEWRELGSNVRVISLEKEFGSVNKTQMAEKVRELRGLIDSDWVVLDLGDLKWLVESRIGEIGKETVAEMGRTIIGGNGRIWAIGIATCATYLRCQVYYPTMEVEWDLQAVPIAPRSPNPGLFPRLGNNNGILSSSIGTLAPPKGSPAIKPASLPLKWPPESNSNNSKKQTLCSQCTENYEQELAKLVAKEFVNSSSNSKALPQWLQIATPNQVKRKECELNWKQNTEELLERWRQTCYRLHSNNMKLSMPLGSPPLKLANLSERPVSPPTSPVKTDLVLGRAKPSNSLSLENAHRGRIKEFPGCKQDNFSNLRASKVAIFESSDSSKGLFKGLMEKVSWQTEAASAVTAAILQSKSGHGKRRGLMAKLDTWLFFMGPDKVGKRKMATVLSELVFGIEPVIVCFDNSRTEGDFRGRTALDRVSEAVKKNPFSVVVLEDIDRADSVVRGTIKRSIERGRLPDSCGREISLGGAIFVLTANWLPNELKCSVDSLVAEEKIMNTASSAWQLELSIGEKRLPDWLSKDENPSKRKKESNGLGFGISLDLNLAVGGSMDDEVHEGSLNSSDVTVDEHEHDYGRLAIKQSSTSSASEFIDCVDSAIVFKPVDFTPMRNRVSDFISDKFSEILGVGRLIRIDENVLDRIVGGIWLSGVGIDEWAESALIPSIRELRSNLTVDGGVNIKLSVVEGGGARDGLPSTVRVAGI